MGSEGRCGYCGKGKGWHLWGCPNLIFAVRSEQQVQVFGIDEKREAAAVLESMPEVE